MCVSFFVRFPLDYSKFPLFRHLFVVSNATMRGVKKKKKAPLLFLSAITLLRSRNA
jgi:hypothetical protein